MSALYYIYLLRCRDGKFYVGSTSNLQRRLHEHSSTCNGAQFVRCRRPIQLIYFETVSSLKEARRREKSIKKLSKSKKTELGSKMQPHELDKHVLKN